MKRTFLMVCSACLALGISLELTPVEAQLPQTRITSIYPAGAQIGSSVDVTVTGGTDLDEIDQLIFSHPGIVAEPKKDAAGNPIASTFVVKVDPGVPAGLYDARVRGLFGISNPRAFRIDALPEVQESEPNNEKSQAQLINLESVVNARSNGGTDVDFFRVAVTPGQTVVIRSEAARLDSLMQPGLQLFNSSGRRLLESRRMFGQEAVIVYTPQTSEDLLIRVADIVYGGGNEYVYRLVVDTRPQIDFVLPLTVSRSTPTTVTAYGRNLPGGQPTNLKVGGTQLLSLSVQIDPTNLSVSQAGFPSYSAFLETSWWNGSPGNLVAVCPTGAAGTVEAEDGTETLVTPPVDLSGHFTAADIDAVRFQAIKGETWIVDVYAHSVGSTADPLLIVERVVPGADGKETYQRLATEDDSRQNPGGNDLPTLNSDPSFLLTVPEDGLYRVRLRDRYAESRTDPRLVWRLSIRRPAPDFQVAVFDSFPSADGQQPSSAGAISLRKGGSYPLPVYVFRQDGHTDAVRIRVENLPPGITSAGATIGAGQAGAVLVLTATEDAAELTQPVQIVGESGAGESMIRRTARITTLVHDPLNGMPRTARMSDTLMTGVMKDRQPFSIVIDPIVADMSQDQQLLVPVRLIRRDGFDGKVDFTFLGLPANTDAAPFAIDKGQDSAVAKLVFKENAAVSGSTILINGTGPVPYRRNPWLAERAQQKVAAADAAVVARQQAQADAEAALKANQEKVAQTTARIAALTGELEKYLPKQKPLTDRFVETMAAYKASAAELARVKELLATTQSSATSTTEQIDAAIKAVGESTAIVEATSAKLLELNQQVGAISAEFGKIQEQQTAMQNEKATAEAAMPELMKAVEAANSALAEAQKMAELAKAEKAAADDAFKKAEEATKPNSVNVRTVSAPLQITLHAAPAKVTAAVPDAGAVKKGNSITAKVTVARKNGFAGPMQITLVLPPGVTGITAEPITIAADQSEGDLIVTAAADAAAADIPNVVIRATGDVGGRAAAVDFPTQLKVTE